jgi:hypothetical protein
MRGVPIARKRTRTADKAMFVLYVAEGLLLPGSPANKKREEIDDSVLSSYCRQRIIVNSIEIEQPELILSDSF